MPINALRARSKYVVKLKWEPTPAGRLTHQDRHLQENAGRSQAANQADRPARPRQIRQQPPKREEIDCEGKRELGRLDPGVQSGDRPRIERRSQRHQSCGSEEQHGHRGQQAIAAIQFPARRRQPGPESEHVERRTWSCFHQHPFRHCPAQQEVAHQARRSEHERQEQAGNDQPVRQANALGVAYFPGSHNQVERQVMNPAGKQAIFVRKQLRHVRQMLESRRHSPAPASSRPARRCRPAPMQTE